MMRFITSSAVLLVLLVKRIQDLVETRIALFVVQKIDKLHDTNSIRLALGAV